MLKTNQLIAIVLGAGALVSAARADQAYDPSEGLPVEEQKIILKNLALPASDKEEHRILELAGAQGTIACYAKLYPQGNPDVASDIGISDEPGIDAIDACQNFIDLARRVDLKNKTAAEKR